MTEKREIDQGKLINNQDWDHLIILDACRFDFFQNVYGEYLEGDLREVKSRGSTTSEWLAKTYPSKYEVSYISANPYINSYGLPLEECTPNLSPFSWKATEHFDDIEDVWDYGWDSEVGAVHPRQVTKKALEKEGRIIAHYMQPHGPYISFNSGKKRRHGGEVLAGGANQTGGRIKHLRAKVGPWLERRLGPKFIWRFRKLLGMEPTWEGEEIWREEGLKGVRKHYQKNLRLVLEEVKKLVKHRKGKTIVTADHGEGLGKKVSGHPINRNLPILRNVPWLEVE